MHRSGEGIGESARDVGTCKGDRRPVAALVDAQPRTSRTSRIGCEHAAARSARRTGSEDRDHGAERVRDSHRRGEHRGRRGLRRGDARARAPRARVVLSLPPSVRVFVAVAPLDMRGSFDALAGAVRRLGLDPVDGHLYLFLSRRRQIAKALWFDGSG
ncbi:MAG: hypothetical protein EOP08_13060, partial [Proteobacteria bacterium]